MEGGSGIAVANYNVNLLNMTVIFLSVKLSGNFSGVFYLETSHENDCDEDNSCS